MKKNFFLKLLPIISLGVLSGVGITSMTSCGDQTNPYKDVKAYTVFNISHIEDSVNLMKVIEGKLPVLGGIEVDGTALAALTMTGENRYWETLLYCCSQIKKGAASSFEIQAASETTIQLTVSGGASITFDNTMNFVKKNKRVCLNVDGEGMNFPISWVYAEYSVV